MNIAIVGYGKMGHEIESICRARGIHAVTIDPSEPNAQFKDIDGQSMGDADVCVEFTHPNSVIDNIRKISKFKKNIVIGTTGWYDKAEEVARIAKDAGIGIIWSGNFSIGVNLYFKMIENAARMMDKFDDYDIFVHEFHHSQKADSPSGTAVMAGKIILNNVSRKKKIVTEELKRKISPEELHISSTRAGTTTGTHIVGFDSAADFIEIKHFAKNRQGFAAGAVKAAEWIKGKKGFYNIDDMMKTIIK